MKARIGPLGKLDCLLSKKTCFLLNNGGVQTGFRGGLILSLPLRSNVGQNLQLNKKIDTLWFNYRLAKLIFKRKAVKTKQSNQLY